MSLEQKKLINQFISEFGFDPFAQQDAQEVPPANCRQRLKLEGKAYPRSGCAVCGQLSPYQKKCDAMLNAVPTPPEQQDAQKKHKPLFAEMIAQHPGLAEELAQQDAQPESEAVRSAWLAGYTEAERQMMAQQDAQAVPQGWRVERVSDDDVRVYGPDAETWLLRANPGKGTFEDFAHRFCFALASCPQPEAAPPAQGMPVVCQGTNCGAADGQDHSPECIVETAEAQGWGDAPEVVAARQLLNAVPTPPAQEKQS